jgi:hypothetical protein
LILFAVASFRIIADHYIPDACHKYRIKTI